MTVLELVDALAPLLRELPPLGARVHQPPSGEPGPAPKDVPPCERCAVPLRR